MALTGRSYIFSAATLLMLAAALLTYDRYAQSVEGQQVLQGWRMTICMHSGISGSDMRFGCHPSQVRAPPQPVQIGMVDGGAQGLGN